MTSTISKRIASGALRQHLLRDPVVHQECTTGGNCNFVACCPGYICCAFPGFFNCVGPHIGFCP
jgi:hypothetical protein